MKATLSYDVHLSPEDLFTYTTFSEIGVSLIENASDIKVLNGSLDSPQVGTKIGYNLNVSKFVVKMESEIIESEFPKRIAIKSTSLQGSQISTGEITETESGSHMEIKVDIVPANFFYHFLYIFAGGSVTRQMKNHLHHILSNLDPQALKDGKYKYSVTNFGFPARVVSFAAWILFFFAIILILDRN